MLNEQDAGRTITLKPEETVAVQLPENPTTGYRWAVVDSGGLEAVDDTYTPAGQTLGGGGTREFTFRAPGPGVYELSLARRRAWQSHASAANFAVTIDAR